jgi:hypothetical protein
MAATKAGKYVPSADDCPHANVRTVVGKDGRAYRRCDDCGTWLN